MKEKYLCGQAAGDCSAPHLTYSPFWIKNQTIAFRMNGAFERSDNYRPVIHSNPLYINPSLEWRPDDKTNVTIEMDYLNDNHYSLYQFSQSIERYGRESVRHATQQIPGIQNDNVNNKTLTYARTHHPPADQIISVCGQHISALHIKWIIQVLP